jgi:hypothetical protein
MLPERAIAVATLALLPGVLLVPSQRDVVDTGSRRASERGDDLDAERCASRGARARHDELSPAAGAGDRDHAGSDD